MRALRILELTAKASFVFFAVLTSWYCMLAYLPFTYHQVHQGGLLPWLGTFARLHAPLHLALFASLTPSLWTRYRNSRVAFSFIVFQLFEIAAEWIHPVLPGLADDRASLFISFVPLVSIVWLALIDIAAAGMPRWSGLPATRDARLFQAALSTGVCAGALSFLSALHTSRSLSWHSVLASVAAHLAVILIAFLLLNWMSAVASLQRHPALLEFVLIHLFGATVIAMAVQFIAAPPIGLQGLPAWCFSIAIGLAIAASHAGCALALSASAASGLDAAVAPVRLVSGWCALGLICVAWPMVSLRLSAMDWNFLMQKLSAAAMWGLLFAIFIALIPKSTRRSAPTPVYALAALLLLGSYRTVESYYSQEDAALNAYAGYNVSYQLTHDLLSVTRGTGSDFYRFLAQNTNIGHSIPVNPIDQNFVEHLGAWAGDKPDIFIFTFDSLRRDYLSPYNNGVTFTPEIARFAAESSVFKNAFTHYGGTGLSEPSIWSGSLLLHKQYVVPFAPMNTLDKLLDANHYEKFITRDSILATLSPQQQPGDLDRQNSGMNYDFCSSVEELSGRLDARGVSARPVFAYTQPQNLHISVIQREGATVPGGKPYSGFYAPYAARLERMDGCFGKFIRHLKETGRYENSVIILTADHGDSLGEEGRWGHAYTIFPEVVRIPLIVHLPESARSQVATDTGALAFSTDISPSLYYLLGNRSLERSALMGRPLFTANTEERRAEPAARQLIVSSYAPVYGTLTDDARSLYIADGVNGRDYLFELKDNQSRSVAVSEPLRTANRTAIREWVSRINHAYGFAGGGQ